MSLPYFGTTDGDVSLRYTAKLAASDILKFHPELKAKLDDVSARKWAYLYVETSGTALARLSFDGESFKIIPTSFFEGGISGIPETLLQVRIWPNAPELLAVPEVKTFRINICSKSFPRAATVDLSIDVVTYLHDPFWKWEEGSEKDKTKLSEAREVYEIATWLIDVKKYKLDQALDTQRYKELTKIFNGMSSSENMGKIL